LLLLCLVEFFTVPDILHIFEKVMAEDLDLASQLVDLGDSMGAEEDLVAGRRLGEAIRKKKTNE
jgi:hypothetical protein